MVNFLQFYLKINVSAFGLFLFPRHVYKRPLDVVVNDFSSATWSLANFFLVRWVTFNSKSNLFKASLLQDLFGHITVLDVFEESIHGGAENGYK